MSMRKFTILIPLTLAVVASAQSPSQTTICVAKLQGSEANNWNLRPAVVQKLSMKLFERRLNGTVIALEADNDKRSTKEAKQKNCDLVVFSQIDRQINEVNSSMAPSPFQRGIANPEATPGVYTLHYALKINDAKNDKTSADKVNVLIDPNSSAKDYEAQGRLMADGVVEKILASIPKK